MTRPPDPHELARRFLDLWQDQVQAMATDPEVADAVRCWTALWTAPMRPAGAGQGGAAPGRGSVHGDGDGLQPRWPAGDGVGL